jgi:hypothetical protein
MPFVGEPASMVWNPDAIYALQLVNHVNLTGHWSFSYGTGMAFDYSLYPLMYLFQSMLSSVLSISPTLCIKYSMAIINLITLLTLYALVNGLFGLSSKTKNLVILMFSLNPQFQGFDSYGHAESFAIILLPLILLCVLGQENPKRSTGKSVVAVILLVAVTMSHHFTSYMIALSLLLPAFLLYLESGRFVGRRHLYVLALILPLAWSTLNANLLFASHITNASDILRSLGYVQPLVGYSYSSIDVSVIYYPSNFSKQITLLRYFLMFLIALVGLMWYSNRSINRSNEKKVYNHFKILLLFFGVLTFLLLYCVDWTHISIPDIRDRIVAFSYFPIAFFLALGIATVSGKISKIIPRDSRDKFAWKCVIKPATICLFMLVFLPTTIFSAFPRLNYDTQYHSVTYTEYNVAPEEQYALGCWVRINLNQTSSNVIFTGSISAQKYVIGYGLFQGTWSAQMVDVAEIPITLDHAVFYVVNIYNLQLPDESGQKLNATTLQTLNEGFGRLYDNGAINLFARSPNPTSP